MIQVVHPGSRSRIPDPGVKKAPDPGSATLIFPGEQLLDAPVRCKFLCAPGHGAVPLHGIRRQPQLQPREAEPYRPRHQPPAVLAPGGQFFIFQVVQLQCVTELFPLSFALQCDHLTLGWGAGGSGDGLVRGWGDRWGNEYEGKRYRYEVKQEKFFYQHTECKNIIWCDRKLFVALFWHWTLFQTRMPLNEGVGSFFRREFGQKLKRCQTCIVITIVYYY